MNRDDILKILQPLLECPTAPTFETAVREEIKRQLSDIKGLKLQVDHMVISLLGMAANARNMCLLRIWIIPGGNCVLIVVF
jgi:hypothetical protein